MALKLKEKARLKRKKRVRKEVFGIPEKPRMSVFRSNKHIYVQLIDDREGITLLGVSSLNFKGTRGANVNAAGEVGEKVAKLALKKGISEVVFDRNGYLYHGRIRALADAARKNGLKF